MHPTAHLRKSGIEVCLGVEHPFGMSTSDTVIEFVRQSSGDRSDQNDGPNTQIAATREKTRRYKRRVTLYNAAHEKH